MAALHETSDLDLPGHYAISLRWTALDPSNILGALLRVNLAQDFEEFRQALRGFDVPSQNFVYADVEGNIGYQMPGKIPIRAGGDGLLPAPGWTDDYEWTGFIPFEELPYAFNPPQGYIVTANNAVVGAEYPYMISLGWDYGYRARRIIELLETLKPLSLQDMAAIQADNYNAMGPVFVPLLGDLWWDDARLAGMVAFLLGWDYQNDADSAQAALFNAFWHHLVLATFADDFPEPPEPPDDEPVSAQILGASDIPSDDRAFLVFEHLVQDPENAWWDDVTTPEREGRDEILARALDAAVEELEDRLGKDPQKWSWGALHGAEFRNASLGQSGIPPIEALFNRGPFPTGGGSSIVNANGWAFAKSYAVDWVPSMRMIVDMGDLANSLAIHTTGQSGHAYHPHYIDMAPLWSTLQYHPMRWTRAQVEAAAEGVLELIP
jgi:penicillin amidase